MRCFLLLQHTKTTERFLQELKISNHCFVLVWVKKIIHYSLCPSPRRVVRFGFVSESGLFREKYSEVLFVFTFDGNFLYNAASRSF